MSAVKRATLVLMLVAAAALQAQRPSSPSRSRSAGPPYAPQDALKTFRLVDDFQIELFAAEPLISDPVAMEVDEDGRLYVVEMHGYPLDVAGSGRVMLLDDTNGDGRPDRSRVFADGLRLPTGIMRWKNGVIVTDSPEVWYLEDADGDGRAEVKRVMLTGFALSNPQHTTNTPIYGLDNWIYLANEGPVRTIRYGELFGDEGKPVHFPDRADSPRLPPDADGRNVRFRPDTGELEMLSSRSQFGQTFDVWGHHFLNTNNRHIYQEVVAARYLARNPRLVVPTVIEQLPDYRLPAEVFPITDNPRFELLTDVGVMTSACGLTYYLADLFPPAYRRAAFVAEGAHNVVHVASVSDRGTTFRASRMHDGREFLASTDPWFRPVNFSIGPDGALYLIDYYRKLFEHPEWMDEATAKSPELYAGKDRGRIYRIVPRGTPAPSWLGRARLGTAPDAELVRRLSDANIWWRRHAQRLLADRKSQGAVPALLEAATTGESGVGRVHALWTLDGLGGLPAGVLERALKDPVAGVRENAIRLVEKRLLARDTRDLADALVTMKEDSDAKVRFQLLLTLGFVDTPAVQAVRDELLVQHDEDEWMQIAALSAANLNASDVMQVVTSRLASRESAGRRTLVVRVGSMIGTSGDIAAIRRTIRSVTSSPQDAGAWWRASALEGLAAGIRGETRRSRELDEDRLALAQLSLTGSAPALRRAALSLVEVIGLPTGEASASIVADAQRTVRDAAADASVRADAIRLLALDGAPRHEQIFRDILGRAEPSPVQMAAVRALGDIKGDRAASLFVELWPRWTPAVRDEAVRSFMRETGRMRVLLEAVSSGRIRPAEIDRPLRIRLMMQADDEMRGRARSLFAETAGAATAAVKQYAAAAALTGNRARGREVFTRSCATCHQYRGGGGVTYGPDLGEVRNRLPLSLLTDILHPNHSIADGYELWMVQLADGTSLGGIIAAETPTSVTFRLPGGTEQTVPRSQIASMQIANVSAMPEGLDAQITLQQMADLIAFLKGG